MQRLLLVVGLSCTASGRAAHPACALSAFPALCCAALFRAGWAPSRRASLSPALLEAADALEPFLPVPVLRRAVLCRLETIKAVEGLLEEEEGLRGGERIFWRSLTGERTAAERQGMVGDLHKGKLQVRCARWA